MMNEFIGMYGTLEIGFGIAQLWHDGRSIRWHS